MCRVLCFLSRSPKLVSSVPQFLVSGFPSRSPKTPPPSAVTTSEACSQPEICPGERQSNSVVALPLHATVPPYPSVWRHGPPARSLVFSALRAKRQSDELTAFSVASLWTSCHPRDHTVADRSEMGWQTNISACGFTPEVKTMYLYSNYVRLSLCVSCF